MKRISSALAAITAVGLTVNTASAESDPIEIIDAGADVIVVVRGVTAKNRIIPKGDKILVPLSGMPGKNNLLSEDETVKRVEVRGTESRRIRIQLNHDRKITKKIAERARVTQVGSGVQIVLPRDPDELTAAPALVDPKADPNKGPALQGAAAPAQATPKATGLPAMPNSKAPESAALPTQRESGTSTGMAGLVLGLLALLGGAALLWQFRKRRNGPGLGNCIEILATQTLGPKNRIVWVAAGEREMLLSVGTSGAQILEAWPRAPRAAGPATNSYRQVARAMGSAPPPNKGTSPSLRGLMELRDQHRGGYGPQPGQADMLGRSSVDEFRAAESEWDGANGTQLSRMVR